MNDLRFTLQSEEQTSASKYQTCDPGDYVAAEQRCYEQEQCAGSDSCSARVTLASQEQKQRGAIQCSSQITGARNKESPTTLRKRQAAPAPIEHDAFYSAECCKSRQRVAGFVNERDEEPDRIGDHSCERNEPQNESQHRSNQQQVE